MSSDPINKADRRTCARRADKRLTRVVHNAHAIRRVFGLERAQRVLENAGFSALEALEILREKLDRRRRANRGG